MFRNISTYKLLNYNKNETKEEFAETDKLKSDTLIQRELEESGIVVNKNGSKFSGSAIKLFLDNLATPNDIKTILKTENRLQGQGGEKLRVCEFCDKVRTGSKICCRDKELQMYLLNNALQKLSFISLNSINSFAGIINENKSVKKRENLPKIPSFVPFDPSQSHSGAKTFKKLKKKLSNLKKYYPFIYDLHGNIIEEWGKNGILNKMKPEVLEMDEMLSSLFWV